LIEADRIVLGTTDETDGLEHPQHPDTSDVGREFGLRERHRNERDGAEVVHLLGLHRAERGDEAGEVGEITVDDLDERELGDQRLDLRIVLPLDEPVDLVALAVQELREVLAVLTGDTGDERSSHRLKATHTLSRVTRNDGIVVIAGGVGAARFLRALSLTSDTRHVTAVVNTGDDTVSNGLYVSPDIDTVIYTLAGAIDPDRGWGLREETWTAMASLARYREARPTESQAPNDWFNLGDRDLATHLYRTARLAEGATVSEVTAEIARAWGVTYEIVPMTSDRVETRVTLAEDALSHDGHTYRKSESVSFQEYFVRLRHSVAVERVEFVGATHATANALPALREAELVVIAPSNPIVSIGPVRALRGVNESLAARRDSVVAISPIIGGAALKGPADRMLRELGMEPSAVGVARLYADICGTFVIDSVDAELAPDIEKMGMRCIVTDTIMKTDHVARNLAATVLGAAAR